MNKLLASLALLGALSACAIGPRASPGDVQLSQSPVYCRSDEECAVMWKRAEQWVRANGEYPIETLTDTEIATSGPVHAQIAYAYRVSRSGLIDGVREIRLFGMCGNRFVCRGAITFFKAAFNRHVVVASLKPTAGSTSEKTP